MDFRLFAWHNCGRQCVTLFAIDYVVGERQKSATFLGIKVENTRNIVRNYDSQPAIVATKQHLMPHFPARPCEKE